MTSLSSSEAFSLAKKYLVGGVNSPVRAYSFVGGTPPFIAKAKGAYIYDIDAHKYIDYVNSWGACIVGHSHPEVVKAVSEQASQGLSYGAPTLLEVKLAQKIAQEVPSMEQMRFVCSGTEATMSAIRVARAYTGHHHILKFHGHYHGHSDALLTASGSGVITQGLPGSAGVPPASVASTLVIPFNCPASLEKVFAEHGKHLACVICELVVGNSGFILPQQDFLDTLKNLVKRYKVLVIADEVMSGFRVGMGGAQKEYDIQPDMTVLGKVIGGGLPIGAYGGRAQIMSLVAPQGDVYQAGTLAGNPLAMASGLATMNILSQEGAFEQLHTRTTQLCKGLLECAQRHGIDLVSANLGGMFGFAFSAKTIKNISTLNALDHNIFKTFFHCMLRLGIYLPPSPYEACFISLAHSQEDVEHTLAQADKAMAELKDSLKP
ncbi:MAG: glutamate-1-semialdehyde 2,1-aminomutase [Proteobacteria bacterium]|nr:glutamate-1-semialdehyde 2,1-aminomutase [Pseudomonadota bacterium]